MILPLFDIRVPSPENSQWEPRDRSGHFLSGPPHLTKRPENTGVHKMSAGRFDWMWKDRSCLMPFNDKVDPLFSWCFEGRGLYFVWPKGFGLT